MFPITCITTNCSNISIFTIIDFTQTDRNGMLLTDQIATKNCRIRQSEIDYKTDLHCSGYATMIAIQKGVLRLTLQNGQYQDFVAGEQFIAADNLPLHVVFDNKIHGHQAEVIGVENLLAIHIKLDNFTM